MEWVDGLATDLHLKALSAHEHEHLLTASREVAHRIERKATPLACAPAPPSARRGALTSHALRR